MQLTIESNIKNYSIDILNQFGFLKNLAEIKPRVVLIDRNVWLLYQEQLSEYFSTDELVFIDATEANKTVGYALELCDKVMNFEVRKNMTIISIGGGIVQDVTGFLASVLYRGVNWVFVPTTLLAQADSCMGSKTSLNYKKFKNLLGTFYPPTKIYLNTTFTQTLNKTDFYSGIGEVVKLHLMGGEENIRLLAEKLDLLDQNRNNLSFLSELVHNSLAIKYSYIKDDEFDTGRRNLLNYGHCFGHALEVSSTYSIPHGTAVVVGMMFANYVARVRALLSPSCEKDILENILLKSFSCQFERSYFNQDIILSALKMDKKRLGSGLPLIVLQEDKTLLKLLDMTQEELFAGIEYLFEILNINEN